MQSKNLIHLGPLSKMQHALHLNHQPTRQPGGYLEQMFGQYIAAYGEEINHWAVRMLNVQAGDQILEIGFGAGLAIQEMVEQNLSQSITGLDCSKTMFEKAGKRNQEAVETGKVRLIEGDVAKLPEFNNAFDKILSVNNIMYWSEPVETLKRLRTTLKPSGSICIVYERNAERVERGDWDEQIELFARYLWHAGFADVNGTIELINPKRNPYPVAGILIRGINPILAM